ncbi:hypothetical protein [Paramicrobacterium fandaimingii]|uniref:hypothetical protein n=1 Tax=Paramicrobacterium fandaimingii TaxID=2708079 RepID=UPI0014215A6D|nr:hypothetical protein [Microbacterium fandaimingii]
MRGILEQLWWRLISIVGVVVTMLIWWPIRDLLIGWLEPWAGWGLTHGLNGVLGFASNANPLGVLGGLAILLISVTLASIPILVFIVLWTRILSHEIERARQVELWIAVGAGVLVVGTAVIGWIDGGRGNATLDAAWAVSVVTLVWAFGMLVSLKLRGLVERSNILIVLLALVALGIALGLTLVPVIL